MILEDYIHKQIVWSAKTFGPGERTKGVIKHILKELTEIEEDPKDVYEWVDVIILALDGAWRAGHQPHEIVEALEHKQQINLNRKWPDWTTLGDEPIEHVKD